MNELQLIKITFDNDTPLVSGRELHEYLEVGTDYAHWFSRMCEYGFDEGESYQTFLTDRSDGLPGKPKTDHQLTIEMAKEISMLQRNEKGKQARQYFIQLEKAWNTPEQIMARALKLAETRIKALTAENEIQRPKALFADAVSVSKTSILIGELAKILKQNGIEIGQNRLFEWLRQNSYLISRKGADFNRPTQKSMELGLFTIKETVITHADGHTSINFTTKVTGKGQIYFVNKFLQLQPGDLSA